MKRIKFEVIDTGESYRKIIKSIRFKKIEKILKISSQKLRKKGKQK